MIELLTLAGLSVAQVFALGFQSRNVNTGQYGWAAGTSFAISLFQAMVWRKVTADDAGAIEALIYALGGAVGIVLAMWVHARFIHREPKP